MSDMKGTFLMRDLSTALQSLAPRDKIIFVTTGAIDASDNLDVDVGDILNDGATPYYWPFKQASAVSSGEFTANTAVEGTTSNNVMVLVICDQKDLKMD